jgi:hypothetical protein
VLELIEALEELDDVSKVYHNLELTEDVVAAVCLSGGLAGGRSPAAATNGWVDGGPATTYGARGRSWHGHHRLWGRSRACGGRF